MQDPGEIWCCHLQAQREFVCGGKKGNWKLLTLAELCYAILQTISMMKRWRRLVNYSIHLAPTLWLHLYRKCLGWRLGKSPSLHPFREGVHFMKSFNVKYESFIWVCLLGIAGVHWNWLGQMRGASSADDVYKEECPFPAKPSVKIENDTQEYGKEPIEYELSSTNPMMSTYTSVPESSMEITRGT